MVTVRVEGTRMLTTITAGRLRRRCRTVVGPARSRGPVSLSA